MRKSNSPVKGATKPRLSAANKFPLRQAVGKVKGLSSHAEAYRLYKRLDDMLFDKSLDALKVKL